MVGLQILWDEIWDSKALPDPTCLSSRSTGPQTNLELIATKYRRFGVAGWVLQVRGSVHGTRLEP